MILAFLNIGTQEMVLIVIAILLLFGGKKLPELARGLGRGIREFKDASDGIKREISDQINNFEKDLDVGAADKSVVKTRAQTISEEINRQEQEVDESAGVEGDGHNEFPEFTVAENTVQHHPGEQPSSEEDHYTYGYDDHFATDEGVLDTPEEDVASSNTPSPDDELPKNA